MVEHRDDLKDERIKQLEKQLLDIEYDIELQRDIIEKQRQEIKDHIQRQDLLKKRARLRVVK
jgi:hypothetical protein|tara:strand:- start:149 stop:334 length:186 start_codon:yes stop_codon:yes gene_type:complete